LLDYEVGLVVEFPITELFIALEDEDDIALFLQETAIDFSRTINVISPVLLIQLFLPALINPMVLPKHIA
jgi:hypothetical protein